MNHKLFCGVCGTDRNGRFHWTYNHEGKRVCYKCAGLGQKRRNRKEDFKVWAAEHGVLIQ